MHYKTKILTLFLTAVVIILTALAGLTFAAENSSKLAAALANISAYFHSGQSRSCIRDLILVASLSLLILWRAFFLQRHR